MNNKTKLILSAVLLTILVSIIYYKPFNQTQKSDLSGTDNPQSTSTEDTLGVGPEKPSQNTSAPAVISDSIMKDRAWKILDGYLKFAQNQDFQGVKSLSYQTSDDCEKDPKGKDCIDRLNTVAFFGSAFKKEEFKNIWHDKKQIILSTDFEASTTPTSIIRGRAIIYFVVDDSNNIKLLKFKPSQGTFISTSGLSDKEALDKIIKMTEDKDMDGIEDYIETCTGKTQNTCKNTDPTKRDTDGNGFWDGLEVLFN